MVMHTERRRLLRRAVSGGVVLSTLSMVPLGLIELAYVLLVRRPIFDSNFEGAFFGLYMFLLLASVGAVLGAVEGLVVLGVSALTKTLAKRRVNEPRWMAWLYSLILLPGIAVFSSLAFSGRRAKQIPGHHLIALGLGVVGLVGAYVALRVVIGARDRFRIRRWGPRQAAMIVPALLGAALLLYVLDQRVLPNLYGFFHLALALGALAMCQLAVGAVYAAYRPTARWMGRLIEPGVALLFFVAGVGGTSWALNRISRWEALRFHYHAQTATTSKVLAAAQGMRLVSPPAHLQLAHAPMDEPLSRSPLVAGPRVPGANLVLISIDALRADHMGAYGYTRRTTPNLDRWAKGAVVFEHAYCQVPHTSFSITSLLTGEYIYSATKLNPGQHHRTIADALRRYGYKTAGFFPPAVFYIDRQDFTTFERSRYGFEYVKYEYLDADKRVDQVLEFLEQHRGAPFFLWVHFFEPHEPYDVRPGFDFGPRAVDRYDGELAYVDHHVGRLLSFLARRHPQTAVALTADHGEEFGEHGAHYHGNALYDPQVRVPLIIGAPRLAPRRVLGAAQIIDLPVTMLALVDVPVGAGMRGTDLGPWLAGEQASRLPPVFAEIERKKLVVHDRHKLICDTAHDFCELYDLAQDPGELRNLISAQPGRVARLRRELGSWMASHAPRTGADEEEASVERLLDRARQKDTGAVPQLVKLVDGPPEVRREVVRLLTLMRAAAAKGALARAARDSDPGVAMQATVGAALLADAGSLARLDPILARDDLPPELRRDALLARARAGDRRATAGLTEYLSREPPIYERLEIIEALGLLGDPAAAPTLLEAARALRTRLYAIEALGAVRARSAVPELVRALRKDRYISWRRAAARALGRIGDARAREALRATVVGDLEGEVVAEALLALARLGALPVPGLDPLAVGPWSCARGKCGLELGGACAAEAPRDLLLLFRLPESGRRPLLRALCGERELGTVDLSTREAAVLHVPSGARSSLRLELEGEARGIELRHATLRDLPRGTPPDPVAGEAVSGE